MSYEIMPATAKYTCDRCGGTGVRGGSGAFEDGCFIGEGNSVTYGETNSPTISHKFDLCNDCKDELLKWLGRGV